MHLFSKLLFYALVVLILFPCSYSTFLSSHVEAFTDEQRDSLYEFIQNLTTDGYDFPAATTMAFSILFDLTIDANDPGVRQIAAQMRKAAASKQLRDHQTMVNVILCASISAFDFCS